MENEKASISEGASLGNFDIQEIMNSKGDMVKCVLLPCNSDKTKEVVVDTTPKLGSVQKLLGGAISFLGQYENEGTVVIVLRDQANVDRPLNKHRLQPPLHKEVVKGDILIMKVAEEDSAGNFFLDYDVESFEKFMEMKIDEFEVSANAKDLAKGLILGQGDESSEDESENEDESVEGESDSDDGQEMVAYLLSNMAERFKSLHGREPTEEELENIEKAIKEKFEVEFDGREEEQEKSEEEQEEIVGEDDSQDEKPHVKRKNDDDEDESDQHPTNKRKTDI